MDELKICKDCEHFKSSNFRSKTICVSCENRNLFEDKIKAAQKRTGENIAACLKGWW